MAILKEPTTVDGAKVITELILHPGVRTNQIPVWDQTLHVWLPGTVAATATGPQGPQGAEGPTGPAGATGHEGPPGHIGDTGHRGDPGPEGHVGPEGHAGPRGERGTGLEFLSAKRDEAAIRAITDMVYGDVHLALDTGNLWVYDSPHPPHNPADADWHEVGHIQGPIGPQGVPGHKGDPGSIGHVGPPGIQGSAGHQGDPGTAGHDGTQGPQGLRGFDGQMGDTGDTGPRGPEGIHGPVGPRGSTGLRGPTGLQGPAGPAGSSGHTSSGEYVRLRGDTMTGRLVIRMATEGTGLTVTARGRSKPMLEVSGRGVHIGPYTADRNEGGQLHLDPGASYRTGWILDSYKDTFRLLMNGASHIIVDRTTVKPGVSGTIKLGSSGLRWREIFATQTTITSDPRLKTKMKATGDHLHKVKAVGVKEYKFLEEPDDDPDRYGFDASELGATFPDSTLAVLHRTDPDDAEYGMIDDDHREHGTWYLDPLQITAVLWRAVQELTEKVEALEA